MLTGDVRFIEDETPPGGALDIPDRPSTAAPAPSFPLPWPAIVAVAALIFFLRR